MTKQKVDYATTSQDMDHLWGSIHATRDSTSVVKVDKAVLSRLLVDHNRLVNGSRS
jgi:hypothetical protein